MPTTPLRILLGAASSNGYAVPAFNIVDQMSMRAVLDAAVRRHSPVIVQVSVRTAQFWGPRVLYACFAAQLRESDATAALHLDHCTDPEFLLHCLDSGWHSALFDSSHLLFDEAVARTGDVVTRARRVGADIEGEFEPIHRVGADVPRAADRVNDVDRDRFFVRSTGVSCFSPDIGTRHGMHDGDPVLDHRRVRELAEDVPVVLHGGSGLSAGCLRDIVSCGVSKINFSSVLKAEYVDTVRSFVGRGSSEPIELVGELDDRVRDLCGDYMELVGSAGRGR